MGNRVMVLSMAGQTLVINSCPTEVRIALLEQGVPVELYVERRADKGVVGNIYRGHVVRVLPGMQAAFVDIGIERTGFLYVNDALPRVMSSPTEEDPPTPLRGRPIPEPQVMTETNTDVTDHTLDTEAPRGFRAPPSVNIADLLSEGQDILVQVQKEPIGSKGARLTRHITLPGRNLVLMPFSDHLGVSHRIVDPEERERLRQALADLAAEGIGCIVRTAAEGMDIEQLRRETWRQKQIWQEILAKGSKGKSPQIVFEELDLMLRTIRDFSSEAGRRIVVDDEKDYERISTFIKNYLPEEQIDLELYRGNNPIFDHFGIEVELERSLERSVWLKSGGYIMIDEAEALTAIDVNSGRFVGKSNLEETITQINLEAVKEIAYQLRLRNIGGIIIIDFIDMTSADNREKILAALKDALLHDRAKTTIVRMSEIGLVEMTRKRVRDSLGQLLTESCPYCKARGFIKSETTVAHEILRAVVRLLPRHPAPRVLINMQPELADFLYGSLGKEIDQLEKKYHTQIIPVAREGFHRERFDIVTSDAD